ncbi:MAG TPA: glycosyltransferase family 39 protein [Candidatus Saccharimonadales bacterium]|nr:glycosyltransferase family 39 protein [Candidatus Saccharimonadales bacterium]
MKKLIKYLTAAVLLLASVTSLWFLLSNLSAIGPALYLLLVITIVLLALSVGLLSPKFYTNLAAALSTVAGSRKKTILLCSLIVLLGLLLRFSFYVHFDGYRPISDPETFYGAAQSIANGHGLKGNFLTAFFPYLAAYDSSLGLVMKLMGNPWLSVIVLNSFFDLLAAAVVYLFVRRLTGPKSVAPLAAFALWVLSPFGILFSVQALPIIIVNFFVILVLYLGYLLCEGIKIRNTKRAIGLSVALGLAVGIANCFRPTFTVFIVVLLAYLAFLVVTHLGQAKELAVLAVAGLVIVSGIFLGIQKLNVVLVSHETGFQAPSNSGGLSVYLGANWESNGRWNAADGQRTLYLSKIYGDNYEAIQNQLTKDGIDRYKSYGIGGTLSLFVRKLNEFSTTQNFMYNANDSIVNYTQSKIAKLYNVYILLFIYGLFAVCALYLYGQAQRAVRGLGLTNPIILLVALTMLGFFLSDMFVEAASRYAQIMYPLFIVVAALFVQQKSESRQTSGTLPVPRRSPRTLKQ